MVWTRLSVALLVACGSTSQTETIVGVETDGPAEVIAGDSLAITCLTVDSAGRRHVIPDDLSVTLSATPTASTTSGSFGLVALIAGELDVACAIPSLNLLDPTPVAVSVIAGPAAVVTTTVDKILIVAGDSISSSCAVTDASGNVITGAVATTRVSPRDTANTTTGLATTFTRAGTYAIGCHVDGASGDPVTVEVVPALPAELRIDRRPIEDVYTPGQLVQISKRALDRYGNVVPGAAVSMAGSILSGSGPITPTGSDGFTFGTDGSYRITATVSSATDGGAAVVRTVDLMVDTAGQSIRCISPTDASVLSVVPGTTVTFNGSVADPAGVASVRVNGVNVAVSGGAFSKTIATRFGGNPVDIAVTDTNGVVTTRLCSFLVADHVANEGVPLAGSVGLRADVLAMSSLVDIATAAIDRVSAENLVDASLARLAMLKPRACDRSACDLSSEVEYASVTLGDATTTVNLVDGGLHVVRHFNRLAVVAHVRGESPGGMFDLSGELVFDGVDVEVVAALDIDLGGHVRALPEPGTLAVQLGALSLQFDGLDPDLSLSLQKLADTHVRTLVRDALGRHLVGAVLPTVDGAVGSLAIAGRRTPLLVTRLAGGTLSLGYGLSPTAVSASSARVLTHLGNSVSGPALHDREGVGAPLQAQPALVDPSSAGEPATATLHVGLMSQTIHALWRGGFFDETANETILAGGFPAGTTVTTAVRLPPTVGLTTGTTVFVDLGSIDARVTVPGVISNLHVVFGARSHLTATLVGSDLVFSAFAVDELQFSTPGVSLSSTTKDTVDVVLRYWLQAYVKAAFVRGFTAAPVPDYSQLGFATPTMDASAPNLIVRGSLAAH